MVAFGNHGLFSMGFIWLLCQDRPNILFLDVTLTSLSCTLLAATDTTSIYSTTTVAVVLQRAT